jgi:hypothetical protein
MLSKIKCRCALRQQAMQARLAALIIYKLHFTDFFHLRYVNILDVGNFGAPIVLAY